MARPFKMPHELRRERRGDPAPPRRFSGSGNGLLVDRTRFYRSSVWNRLFGSGRPDATGSPRRARLGRQRRLVTRLEPPEDLERGLFYDWFHLNEGGIERWAERIASSAGNQRLWPRARSVRPPR